MILTAALFCLVFLAGYWFGLSLNDRHIRGLMHEVGYWRREAMLARNDALERRADEPLDVNFGEQGLR